MKNTRFLTFVLMIGTLILSACSTPAATATPAAVGGSVKVEAMPVAFIGIVDSITGEQWVISGTTVTVDASVVRDGPFSVGDRIKVEGFVNPDGSFTVSRVEAPVPQDAPTMTPFALDNTNESSNANTNDANLNDDNSNASNIDDSNGNDSGVNINDNNSNDDNGGNSNSDHSNDNSGGNSNDDTGKDDNSGNGGGNSNDD